MMALPAHKDRLVHLCGNPHGFGLPLALSEDGCVYKMCYDPSCNSYRWVLLIKNNLPEE